VMNDSLVARPVSSDGGDNVVKIVLCITREPDTL